MSINCKNNKTLIVCVWIFLLVLGMLVAKPIDLRKMDPDFRDIAPIDDSTIVLPHRVEPSRGLSAKRTEAQVTARMSIALIDKGDVDSAIENARRMIEGASELNSGETIETINKIAIDEYAISILEAVATSSKISPSKMIELKSIAQRARADKSEFVIGVRNEYTTVTLKMPSSTEFLLRNRTTKYLYDDAQLAITKMGASCDMITSATYQNRAPELRDIDLNGIITKPQNITPEIKKRLASTPNSVGKMFADSIGGFVTMDAKRSECDLNSRIDALLKI